MSTFPLISHHLFVSAVGHDDAIAEDPALAPEAARAAAEVPLEVIETAREIPAESRGAIRKRIRTSAR